MKATVFMNKIVRWLHAGVVSGAISIAVVQDATAGTFSISPLRIELDRKQNIGVLTIHNDEDAPLLIQADIVAWSQENNEDISKVLSKDLLVTPPIIQLAPKSDQIVRIALRHVNIADFEMHYRLILNEVPPPVTKDFVGLSVALRMSIPIFIAPASSTHADIKWHATWLNDGTLGIEAANEGNAHLQVMDFDLQFGDAQKVHVNPARYVLPGSHITWNVKAPADIDHHAALSIHGFSDQGEFSAAVDNAEAH